MGRKGLRVGIIGAGPTGLTAALLLQRLGVDATVFETHGGTTKLPQAHQVNTRTAEIFEGLGVYDRLVAVAAPDELTHRGGWYQSLAARPLATMDFFVMDKSLSHVEALNLGQDSVERVLSDRLAELGRPVRFDHRVTAVRAVPGGAELDVTADDGTASTATFDLVLACDGSGSGTRKSLGIEMDGPPSLGQFTSCYFDADLSRFYQDNPGPIRFIAGPDVRGSLMGFDMDKHWAIMCSRPPGATLAEYTDEVMTEVVRRAIGDNDVEFTITNIGEWNMSAQVARTFRSGPIILMGDAAHRFPPTGGLGLNTGVQDAHNLAWKIDLVDRGLAGDALLNTFEQERRPIAILNCKQSVANALRMSIVDTATGTSSRAPVVAADMLRPAAPLPSLGLNPEDPDPVGRAAEVQAAVDEYSSGVDTAGIDLGDVYGVEVSDEVLRLPPPPRDSASSPGLIPEAPTQRGSWRPKAIAGARLPHVWLRSADGQHPLADLLAADAFTLLTAPGTADSADRVAVALAESGLPLQHVSLSWDSLSDPAEWAEVMDEASNGMLLVRPDGHVVWLCTGEPDHSDLVRLSEAVAPFAGIPATTIDFERTPA